MTQLDAHGAQIIAFVERYWQTHHRSPSYEEIGAAVGLASKDHVSRDLRRLKDQGYVSFTPGVSRSIVLLKNTRGRAGGGDGTIPLPVVGVLHASAPPPALDAEIAPLDWITIARGLIDDEEDVYALRVRGDSMMDALVNDGDVVVLKRSGAAMDGEMVAAWVKSTQKTSLKYYHRENGHVRLQPANPNLPPVLAKPSDVIIQGKVLVIVRQASRAPGTN